MLTALLREARRRFGFLQMPAPLAAPLRSVLRGCGFLPFLLLAVHAPAFFNNGLYMDDWLLLKLRPDAPTDLDFMLHGAGHPLYYGYFTFANWTGAPITVMKLATLLSIVFGALALFDAAMRLRLLTTIESAILAFAVFAYPGYEMWAGKANSAYVLSFGMFFVGTWLLVAMHPTRGALRLVLRATALAAFFLSFGLNSIIALYLSVGLGLFIAVWRASDRTDDPMWRRATSAMFQTIWRYGDFLLLPIAYWVLLSIFFARGGAYAGHYTMHGLTLSGLFAGLEGFEHTGIRRVMTHALMLLRHDRVSQGLFVLAGIVAGFLMWNVRRANQPAKSFLWPALAAIGIFVVCALPYIISGNLPGEHFYETRHLLLFGLPLGLCLISLQRIIDAQARLRGAGVALSILVLGVLSGKLLDDYFFMQARWLKLQAVMNGLSVHYPQPPARVFNLDDGYLNYPSRHVYFGTSEISGALRLVWGNEPFVGLTLAGERSTFLVEMAELSRMPGSAYRNLDLAGPQATIIVEPGPLAATNEELSMRYYGCRLVACDLTAMLTGLARIRIEIGSIAGLQPIKNP